MRLARELHYTVSDLLDSTTSEELGLWMALYAEEQENARLEALVQRAESARMGAKKKRG
jgi:hypothetical protein